MEIDDESNSGSSLSSHPSYYSDPVYDANKEVDKGDPNDIEIEKREREVGMKQVMHEDMYMGNDITSDVLENEKQLALAASRMGPKKKRKIRVWQKV